MVDFRIREVGGTSASCPLFANLVAKINAKRQEAGKGPLGYLNPALYALDGVLVDVTVGNNGNGCSSISSHGYPVVEGYDAVTGLGNPRYDTLLEALLAL